MQTCIGPSEEHVSMAGIPTEASIYGMVEKAMPGRLQNVYCSSAGGGKYIWQGISKALENSISRTSIWQWIHHQKTLSNGKPVTKALFRQMLGEEMKVIASELGEERFSQGRFDDAARLMEQITTSDELIDFLTLPGYRLLA